MKKQYTEINLDMGRAFAKWAAQDMPLEYYKEYKKAPMHKREEMEAKQGFYAGWIAAMRKRGFK